MKELSLDCGLVRQRIHDLIRWHCIPGPMRSHVSRRRDRLILRRSTKIDRNRRLRRPGTFSKSAGDRLRVAAGEGVLERRRISGGRQAPQWRFASSWRDNRIAQGDAFKSRP